MRKPKISDRDKQWLAGHGAELKRRDAAIRKLDRTKIEIDKEARALDVQWAEGYARHRPRLIETLDKLGIKEWQWCKRDLDICTAR